MQGSITCPVPPFVTGSAFAVRTVPFTNRLGTRRTAGLRANLGVTGSMGTAMGFSFLRMYANTSAIESMP